MTGKIAAFPKSNRALAVRGQGAVKFCQAASGFGANARKATTISCPRCFWQLAALSLKYP